MSSRAHASGLPIGRRGIPLHLLALVLAACAGNPGGWQAPLGHDHPLLGRIWDVEGHRFIDEEVLLGELETRPVVLLGEKHDNPDHHVLQARVIRALSERGRRPLLAFEMLESDKEPALREALERDPTTPADIREAVDWDSTGWPDWEFYEPIFEAALDEKLRPVAVGLPRDRILAMRETGYGGLESEPVEALIDATELSDERRESLEEQIRASHCGHASPEMVEAMVRVQRARDAWMTHAMLDAMRAGDSDGAVLIAGSGHTRKDRAMPLYIAASDPAPSVASLAFIEVDDAETDPEEITVGRHGPGALFDFIWLTARLEDDDPCERFRDQLEKLKREPETPEPEPSP